MTQRRQGRRRTTGETDIIRFIAKQTGQSVELVNRVVDGGEPWPRVVAFQQYLESQGIPLDTALGDHDDMLEDDLDTMELEPEAVNRHQQHVATSLGLSEAIVASISDAMHEFFRQRFADLRREKRDCLRRKRRR